MVEFSKAKRCARVLEEKEPDKETVKTMNQVAEGKVNTYKPAKEIMISSL